MKQFVFICINEDVVPVNVELEQYDNCVFVNLNGSTVIGFDSDGVVNIYEDDIDNLGLTFKHC